MQVERVNPEVVLEAARLAFPEFTWNIAKLPGMADCVVRTIYDHDDENAPPLFMEFHPPSHPSDTLALQSALEMAGWRFFFNNTKGAALYGFHAEKDDFTNDDATGELLWVHSQDQATRALKCVSAQCAIPLYLEKT